MALKPKFEDQSETVAAETAQATDAAAAATTAVATAAATSAVAIAKGVNNSLAALKDNVKVEWDTLLRIVPDGSDLTVDDESAGPWLEMQITSWQDSYSIEPGDQSEAAKKFLRFSDDNVVLRDSGQPVAEYVKYLKEVEGYENACVKHRVILVGLVEKTAKESKVVGQLAQISLAPQSKKNWDRYQLNATVRANMGRLEPGEDPARVRLSAVRTSKGQYKFTVVEVSPAKS